MSTQGNNLVTVIIPACNETETIGATLTELVDTYPVDQIIVAAVDKDPASGKTEGPSGPTGTAAKKAYPPVELVHGGAGLSDGVLNALPKVPDRNIVVVMDADGSHNPDLLPALIGRIRDGADIAVAGYRTNHPTPHRRALTKLSLFATRLRMPRKTKGVPYPQSGYFATKPGVLSAAAGTTPPRSYKILAAAILHNPPLKIVTEPTQMRERTAGSSKLNLKVVVADIKLLATKSTAPPPVGDHIGRTHRSCSNS